MAAILVLVPDLLFGSRVMEMLTAAGHDVELAASEPEVWDKIAGSDVLVADLSAQDVDPVVLVDTLKSGGEMAGTKTLGFFPHVEPQVRDRALNAGFDLVVPRSRMNREGADLVAQLVQG